MPTDTSEYVHVRHVDAFIEAARKYQCHVLVRKTGRGALQYVGRPGYAGKLANMKAKTAVRDLPPYQLQGLVCSPLIHPNACKPGASADWQKSMHLITVPKNGFEDDVQPLGCPTPYLLQTNPAHRHYGCVAWVENGLLVPRYVHGDYDLYAIIPAGKIFEPSAKPARAQPMTAAMDPPSNFTLAQRVARDELLHKHRITDQVRDLSVEVATFINLRIAKAEGSIPAGLMVNHGEQVNLGIVGQDFQSVLAFLASPRNGEFAITLNNRAEHQEFYRQA